MKRQRPAWSEFDPVWYKRVYGHEVRAHGVWISASAGAESEEMESLESFYYATGVGLRHSPNPFFDESWYVNANPDVAEAVAQGKFSSGFEHYGLDGHQSRSPHWLFSESFYLNENLDLTRDRLTAAGFANGYDHYLRAGDHEMRTGHWLFDPMMHRSAMEDLSTRELSEPDHSVALSPAEQQFDSANRHSGEFKRFILGSRIVASCSRLSWYFDPVWYLNEYPAVRSEIQEGHWSCALEHYLRNPTPTLFCPNPWFSEEFYRSIHLDLADALEQGRFRNSFDHFLRYGALERRKPHPDVDLHDYFRSAAVQTAIEQGRVRDVFVHLLRSIEKSGRSADASHSTGADMLVSDPLEATQKMAVSEENAKRLYAVACHNALPALVRAPPDFRVAEEVQSYSASGMLAVSVIIVACNRFAFTMSTLASLRANFSGSMQVIVVDSGSRDEVSEIERYVPGLEVLRFRSNVGFIEGCNAALLHVRAPATLFLNNDIQLQPGAIQNGLRRLWSKPSECSPMPHVNFEGDGATHLRVGAVGAKIVRTHGRLQEAGSILWSNGNATGYLRDEDPQLPEANFVREVDYCSAAFLLCRTSLLKELGGFNTVYQPAYFEEADLCVRMREAGYSVVYDPSVHVIHFEFGTTDPTVAIRMIERNLPVFRERNANFLRSQHDQPIGKDIARRTILARTAVQSISGCYAGGEISAGRLGSGEKGLRILFIEDRLPFRHLGSGFTRSSDIIRTMSDLGYHVTVFPIYKATETIGEIYREFSDYVEVIFDRELPDLSSFLEERAGFYDGVWVARTHNAERLLPVLLAHNDGVPSDRLVLDTEAVAAVRVLGRRAVAALDAGDHASHARYSESLEGAEIVAAAAAELKWSNFFQRIVAVSESDAQLIRDALRYLASSTVEEAALADGPVVEVLGHVQPVSSHNGPPWSDRHGLLFLGSIHDDASPNRDSLNWFTTQVLPLLNSGSHPTVSGSSIKFSIAGTAARGIDLSPLVRTPGVELLGRVWDLESLYARHRVFVAPTRFAAGIPYKVHEAAAHGLPVVATSVLCRQLGWRPGEDMLVAGTEDPRQFADAILELYNNEQLWLRIRENALKRIRSENNVTVYAHTLSSILSRIFSS